MLKRPLIGTHQHTAAVKPKMSASLGLVTAEGKAVKYSGNHSPNDAELTKALVAQRIGAWLGGGCLANDDGLVCLAAVTRFPFPFDVAEAWLRTQPSAPSVIFNL